MAAIRAGEMVVGSFRLVFGNARVFLATLGVALLPALALNLVSALFIATPSARSVVGPGADPALAARFFALVAVAAVVAIVSSLLALVGQAVGIVVADRLMRGEPVTLADAWTEARARLGSFLGTIFLIIGMVVAGVVVLVVIAGVAIVTLGPIAGILVAFVGYIVGAVFLVMYLLRWSLAGTVAILERNDAMSNLRRSEAVTRGARAAIFGGGLLLALVVFLPAVMLTAPFSLSALPSAAQLADPSFDISTFQPSIGARVAQWAVSSAFSVAGAALFVAFFVLCYRRLSAPPPEATLGPIGFLPPPGEGGLPPY